MENKKNLTKSITVVAVVFFILAVAMVGAASAKSLYVIADHHGNPTPVHAYNIAPDGSLSYQTVYNLPKIGAGAGDLTIDTDSATIYVTYEGSSRIDKFSSDFTNLGHVILPVSNLAGIVVDQDNGLIYVMRRGTDDLYIYDLNFNPATPNKVDLGNGVNNAYGIALDETHDWLFVADREQTVRYFNTADWSLAGSFTVDHNAVAIAVDAKNGFVYTGAAFAGNYKLCKYDMGTSTKTSVQVGTNFGAMGVAVDPKSGLVYVTTGYSGDDLRVYDSDLNLLYTPIYLGTRPAGLCIPGKEVPPPTNLTLTKEDDVSTSVKPGDSVTYTISYENKNSYEVTSVTIEDTLPSEVNYVSCTGGGTYDAVAHTVTWNIGTVAAGASGSVTLTVQVKPSTPDGIITNYATIDSTETPPTTRYEETKVLSGVGPTVESADILGAIKNIFLIGESVYAIGTGYATTTTYDLHIVADTTWSNGMLIPARVPGTEALVTTDASGNIAAGTLIWSSCAEGKYDIVVDVNGNGDYDAATDALDADVDVGFEAVPEFSTIAIPVASILGLLFFFNHRKRKREQ